MLEEKTASHPLGSQRRWLESWIWLCVPFVLGYVIVRILLPDVTAFLILPGLILSWTGLFWNALDPRHTLDRDWHVPWFSNIGANLAYGSAEENGIRFRAWFRRHFVSWRGIARLEYWPDRGLIAMHLFNRFSPVIFAVETTGADTVDYITGKIEQAWPGRSTFLISFEKPADQDTGFAARTLSNLGFGWKALSTLLTAFIGCCYGLARFALLRYEDTFLKGLLLRLLPLCGVYVIVGGAEILWRKFGRNTTIRKTSVDSGPVNEPYD